MRVKFEVWGLGFEIWGLEFEIRVLGFGAEQLFGGGGGGYFRV